MEIKELIEKRNNLKSILRNLINTDYSYDYEEKKDLLIEIEMLERYIGDFSIIVKTNSTESCFRYKDIETIKKYVSDSDKNEVYYLINEKYQVTKEIYEELKELLF